MISTDYLPFIAIIVTLLIGILTCLISFLNYQRSKKTWHVNIASARRKERMDNLIIFYSKVVALAHQDSVLGYAVKSDYIFIEKILESYSNLNMLLDHRFPRDTELAHAVRKLTKTAIEYFNTCMLSHDSSNHESEYKEFYQTTIPDIDRLCNIIIGVEWTRIKKEAEKGLPIPAERWQKQYEEDAVYYDKWNEQYG